MNIICTCPKPCTCVKSFFRATLHVGRVSTILVLVALLLGLVSKALAQPSPSYLDAQENFTLAPQLRARTSQALDEASMAQPSQRIPNIALPPPSAPVKANSGDTLDPAALSRQFNNQYEGQEPQSAQLYVFVSLSMPEAALERLAQDVRRVGGAMVLRGLVDRSMRKTTEYLARYSRLGVNFQIDPESFKRFEVSVVPSFVLALKTDACQSTQCQYHSPVVEGDVSVAYALEKMQMHLRGELLSVDQDMLAKLEGRR